MSYTLIYDSRRWVRSDSTDVTIVLPIIAGGTGNTTGTATVNANLTGPVTSVGNATTITAGAVTLAMQANMATASVVYRKTAGSGAPEVNTLATLKTDLGLTGTNSGDQTITLTGPITGSGTGSFATAIASQTGTGTKFVMDTSPVILTPTIGAGGTGTTISTATIDSGSGVNTYSALVLARNSVVKAYVTIAGGSGQFAPGASTDDLVIRSSQKIVFTADGGTTTHLTISNAGIVTHVAPVALKGYTVATLPAGVQGYLAFCTDLLAPTFLAAAVGGGAIVGLVLYNGSAWVTV